MKIPAISLMGVPIHCVSPTTLHRFIIDKAVTKQKAIIAYVNVHAMNLAWELPAFRDFFNKAALVFCDGNGVKWGARLLGLHIPYRYTYPDWMVTLGRLCVEHDVTLFFLGSTEGVAATAAARLQAQVPGLLIVGTHHGFFDKTIDSEENQAVVRLINEVEPDILVIGFGMPLQEAWLMENWPNLKSHVALPAGAVFDYISGNIYRAPSWMTDNGLEWLGRLLVEPRRLWSRYLIGNPLFLWRLVRFRWLGS